VAACKEACGDKLLKVIIESGELKEAALIREASLIAIAAGADFIKTSTGKVAVNATLDAAGIMLAAIRSTGAQCGFKAAGGVRTAAEAAEYIDLAEHLLGEHWVTAEHFRFGASSLLANLQAEIAGTAAAAAALLSAATPRIHAGRSPSSALSIGKAAALPTPQEKPCFCRRKSSARSAMDRHCLTEEIRSSSPVLPTTAWPIARLPPWPWRCISRA
jgi:hypothetical protein